MADNYGQDTYYAYVLAKSVRLAVAAARLEASKVDDCYAQRRDYFVLCVTAGHNDDLNTGRL